MACGHQRTMKIGPCPPLGKPGRDVVRQFVIGNSAALEPPYNFSVFWSMQGGLKSETESTEKELALAIGPFISESVPCWPS